MIVFVQLLNKHKRAHIQRCGTNRDVAAKVQRNGVVLSEPYLETPRSHGWQPLAGCIRNMRDGAGTDTQQPTKNSASGFLAARSCWSMETLPFRKSQIFFQRGADVSTKDVTFTFKNVFSTNFADCTIYRPCFEFTHAYFSKTKSSFL